MTVTVYTLAARETVLAIRESMARVEPSHAELRLWFGRAVEYAVEIVRDWKESPDEIDWEALELWTTLASDIAGKVRKLTREGQ